MSSLYKCVCSHIIIDFELKKRGCQSCEHPVLKVTKCLLGNSPCLSSGVSPARVIDEVDVTKTPGILLPSSSPQ